MAACYTYSMDVETILSKVDQSLPTQHEHDYFLIHVERYRYILEQIESICIKYHESGLRKKQVVTHDTLTHGTRLRILDVGCFPYHLGRALELMGHEVYGISSSHEPIKSKKIKICNVETDIFPFKDNFFDLVVCTEVLEHLPQSPLHAIHEMQRVTMPRGFLLLTTPNIARSINRAKILLGKSVTYPLSQVLENEGKGSNIYHRHNREYTLSELTTLLTHGHWTVAEARHFVSYTPMRKRKIPDPLLLKAGKFANYFLMLAVSSLRDTLYVLGCKDAPGE